MSTARSVRWVPGWSSTTSRRCAACHGQGEWRGGGGWISCDTCEGTGEERLVCVVCFDLAVGPYDIGPAGECLGCCRVCETLPSLCRCAVPHALAPPPFLAEDVQYRAMGG